MTMQNSKVIKKILALVSLLLPSFAFAGIPSIGSIIINLAFWSTIPLSVISLIITIILFLKFRKNKKIHLVSFVITAIFIAFAIFTISYYYFQQSIQKYNKKIQDQKCIEALGIPCPESTNLGY